MIESIYAHMQREVKEIERERYPSDGCKQPTAQEQFERNSVQSNEEERERENEK